MAAVAYSRSRPGTAARGFLATLLPALALLGWAGPSPAQLAVSRWAIAGGGGRSTSGDYLSVDGTIGQCDAGVATGGSWNLTGGFWPAQASGPVSAPMPVALPTHFAWIPCVPNPVSDRTHFAFDLPHDGEVRIEVYSVAGARLGSLFDRSVNAGHLVVDWDATGSDGRRLPSGVYLVVAHAGGTRVTQHVVIVD
jgi:hypothetical protein